MIRAELVVESMALSLSQLTAAIGCAPDSGRTVGGPSRLQPARTYRSSLWVLNLRWDEFVHGGTEGISSAVAALGDEFGDRLARLTLQGCDVVLSIVQHVEGENDESTLGISLSEDAVKWLARAKAGISVDQYVGGES